MTNVGPTTALLVVAGQRLLSQSVSRCVSVFKAEALAADGGAITILTADELRDRIAGAPAQAEAT